MLNRGFVVASVMIVTLVFTCSNGAFADERVDMLVDEVAALRDQVARQDEQIGELKRQRAEVQRAEGDWMAQREAEDVRAIVEAVLADAEQQATLTGIGIAGYENGMFTIASADRKFALCIKGMILFRHVVSVQDDSADEQPRADGSVDGTDDDFRVGFEGSRTRFGFAGHVFDPSWQYFIWTGFGRNGDALLLDMYVRKQLGGGFSITAGQFKRPFFYEALVSETAQQFVDRSLIAGEFSRSYTQGVLLSYLGDAFRFHAAYHDGRGRINSPWDQRDTQWGAIAMRGEVKLLGDWAHYKDFQGWPGQEPLLVIAGAVNYQQDEYGTSDPGEAHHVDWTVDASFERSRWNLFLAVVGNHETNGSSLNQYAVVAQSGFFVTDDLELIGRYEFAAVDRPGEDFLHLVTVGANYFFYKQRLKFQTDFGYSFNALGPTLANNAADWRRDEPGADGQFVARSQIVLRF